MLVIHYTGMPDARSALQRLSDATAKVSAHYLIDEDGVMYRMVAEDRRAWHAGVSAWRGRRDVNDRSIGIELVNPGHEFGYSPFPPAQMAALIRLATGILARHPIPPRNVVGHSDIAPERKQDPGELFDWAGLARAGIGLWPPGNSLRSAGMAGSAAKARAMLAGIGYDIPASGLPDCALGSVVAAFQRHFRPHRVDGLIDGETLARMEGLLSRIT